VARKRILCIDDEPDIRKVLATALRFTLQAEVFEAASAQAAFDFLEHNEIPDIIVLDGMMPQMDGYAACRRLRENERFAGIPIVFLTANALPRDR